MSVQAAYTIEELCRLWRVRPRTLYWWLRLERLAGRGPSTYESVTRSVAGKKATLIRADYAKKIQDRYVFRVFSRKQRAAVPRQQVPARSDGKVGG